MSLVREGIIGVDCADFQAAENGDSHLAGHADRFFSEQPQLSDLMKMLLSLDLKVDNYNEQMGKCEYFIQGQCDQLRKCEDFMHQQMAQMDTLGKWSGSEVVDFGPQLGGNNEVIVKNEQDEGDEENEDKDHESLTLSDKDLLQLFIETQKLTIEEDGDWMESLWHMAQDENGCHQNPSLASADSRICYNIEEGKRWPLVLEQEGETLEWVEEDLEEEWELKSRISSSHHNSSSSSTEDLLDEWYEIEAELGTTDFVQPAVTSSRSHEIKMEAALAEWQLLEEFQEAKLQLDGMIAQLSSDVILCGHTGEDVIGKISDTVRNARDEIRRIVAESPGRNIQAKSRLVWVLGWENMLDRMCRF